MSLVFWPLSKVVVQNRPLSGIGHYKLPTKVYQIYFQEPLNVEEYLKQINELKIEIENQKLIIEKHAEEKKDFSYKLSGLAQEMKNQKIRLDRETEKSKVIILP